MRGETDWLLLFLLVSVLVLGVLVMIVMGKLLMMMS